MFPFPPLKALQKALEEKMKPSGFTCPRCKDDYDKLLWKESGWICASCNDKKESQ